MHLNSMKTAVLFAFLLFTGTIFGQLRGSYRYRCSDPVPPATLDTSKTSAPQGLRIGYIPTLEWRGEKLIIKRFGRFKIEGSGTVTDLGLNRDNPTIYGRYKLRDTTLTLKCRKSIQHFYKLAEKRRVKVKMDKAYLYAIDENGNLTTLVYCYWYKLED